uniref:Copper transport protein n=1 Tax=Anguilla anguilla TaxID=7936 RepID=A0A0E9UYE1_ANGAN
MHILQTCVHVVQVTLGYLLMLCVMSYNVWIFLGVIVGSLIGYFLAFPLLAKILREEMEMEREREIETLFFSLDGALL